jgi:hypothetical protein
VLDHLCKSGAEVFDRHVGDACVLFELDDVIEVVLAQADHVTPGDAVACGGDVHHAHPRFARRIGIVGRWRPKIKERATGA